MNDKKEVKFGIDIDGDGIDDIIIKLVVNHPVVWHTIAIAIGAVSLLKSLGIL